MPLVEQISIAVIALANMYIGWEYRSSTLYWVVLPLMAAVYTLYHMEIIDNLSLYMLEIVSIFIVYFVATSKLDLYEQYFPKLITKQSTVKAVESTYYGIPKSFNQAD